MPATASGREHTTFKALFEQQRDIHFIRGRAGASPATLRAVAQIQQLNFQKAFMDNTMDLKKWIDYARGRPADGGAATKARSGIEALLKERRTIHDNLRPLLGAFREPGSGMKFVPVTDTIYVSLKGELKRLYGNSLERLAVTSTGKVVPSR